jgi:hypothetical protein
MDRAQRTRRAHSTVALFRCALPSLFGLIVARAVNAFT